MNDLALSSLLFVMAFEIEESLTRGNLVGL